MKSFIFVVLLFCVFALKANAAVSRGDFNDPKYPGKCTIKENLILSSGQKIKDPDQPCGKIACFEEGYAEFYSCGAQSIDVKGCRLGDYLDVKLDYPDCCKREIICNEN